MRGWVMWKKFCLLQKIAHPEKRCLLQAGSTWSCLANSSALIEQLKQLEICYFFPHIRIWMVFAAGKNLRDCYLPSVKGPLQHSLKCRSTSHAFPELCTNQLLKWMFRAVLITALKDWAPEWYSVQIEEEFSFLSTNPLCLQCVSFFPHIQRFAAQHFGLPLLLCFWFVFFYVPIEAKSKQSNLRWSRGASDGSLLKTITSACRLMRKMVPVLYFSKEKEGHGTLAARTGKMPHCLIWTGLVLLNHCFSS